ncbi:MAG: SpoIIE family protein phosphatase [Anaerolineales bacterium]|nr:SpoIIE family protein phosphatase [Anaerolineales bacterium]
MESQPQPRGQRFNLLYRIAQTFNASLDLEEVLNRVIDEVIEATGAERGFIVLRQPDGELAFKAARGLAHQDLETPERQVSLGIIEQVMNSCQAIVTQDALGDARFLDQRSVHSLKLVSILCVPLTCKGQTQGAIYVENRIQRGIFGERELDLLQAIATSAAVALENARLFSDLQARIQTLNMLYEISADLTARLDLEQLLTVTVQRVQQALGAPAASLLTVEDDELVFRVALGEKSQAIKPFRLPIDQGIAGWVVKNGQGEIVNDVRTDPRFYQMADDQTGFVTRSIIAVPLLVKDRPIGVIELFNKPGGFSTTDLELLTSIASSAAIAIENARLYLEAIDKGRMERELQMAVSVQTGLLPSKMPALPGYAFAARWQPAREVSGDFYDFIHLHDASQQVFNTTAPLGMVIADVTDKGIPAALFMAFTRSILRASLDQAITPAEGITKANHLICADSDRGLFVTLFYGQLNPNTGEVLYVNAGHNPPLHYQAAQERLQRLMPTGIPIGIVEDFSYQQASIHLQPGDFLVCYTDGITEAIDPQQKEFGLERLENTVRQHRLAPAEELLQAIESATRAFTGPQGFSDDTTIVVIRRE